MWELYLFLRETKNGNCLQTWNAAELISFVLCKFQEVSKFKAESKNLRDMRRVKTNNFHGFACQTMSIPSWRGSPPEVASDCKCCYF